MQTTEYVEPHVLVIHTKRKQFPQCVTVIDEDSGKKVHYYLPILVNPFKIDDNITANILQQLSRGNQIKMRGVCKNWCENIDYIRTPPGQVPGRRRYKPIEIFMKRNFKYSSDMELTMGGREIPMWISNEMSDSCNTSLITGINNCKDLKLHYSNYDCGDDTEAPEIEYMGKTFSVEGDSLIELTEDCWDYQNIVQKGIRAFMLLAFAKENRKDLFDSFSAKHKEDMSSLTWKKVLRAWKNIIEENDE